MCVASKEKINLIPGNPWNGIYRDRPEPFSVDIVIAKEKGELFMNYYSKGTEKMIFKNKEWEKLSLNGEIPHFGYYHRYRLPDGTVNPEFYKDQISSLILDVKDKKEKGINFFYNMLNSEISDDVTICVVPSHLKNTTNDSGIAILARRLANDNRNDKVDYLLRVKSIDKLAHGGERSRNIQRESIGTNPEMTISGDIVLLVDDVTTSGNSLMTCRDILMENGAARVAMFALGQSI